MYTDSSEHQKDASHLLIGNEIGLFNTTVIHTIEDQAASITAWSQDYDQLSNGSFFGGMNEIWLENSQFFLESTSKALRQSCNSWPGAVWFGITEPSNLKGFINEQPFVGGDVLTHPGGINFELITPSNFNIIGLVIDKKILKHYLHEYNPEYDFEEFIKVSHWRLNKAYKEYNWLQLIHALRTLKRAQKISFDHCNLLEDQLIYKLISALLSDFTPSNMKKDTLWHYRTIVAKTKEYVLDQQNEVITVKEICQHFNVSRRTLQNAFQATLNINPNYYLKAMRLNAFRKALLEKGSHITVQDIAAHFGFWHTSQLAADYRKMFGELPSHTVKNGD